jgi:hypothetical protein
MAKFFDRYKKFRENGEMKPLPGIKIPESSSDLFALYKKGQTRLDKISNSYYNNPYNGWLIMLANPEFGGLEFNIPDMTSLRVPYPLEDGIQRYIKEIEKHKTLYG